MTSHAMTTAVPHRRLRRLSGWDQSSYSSIGIGIDLGMLLILELPLPSHPSLPRQRARDTLPKATDYAKAQLSHLNAISIHPCLVCLQINSIMPFLPRYHTYYISPWNSSSILRSPTLRHSSTYPVRKNLQKDKCRCERNAMCIVHLHVKEGM